MRKQFGGKATKGEVARYADSENWKNNKFMNLEVTSMDINLLNLPKLLYKQFFEKKGRAPKVNLPILPLDKTIFLQESDKAKFVWYGHSAVLMRMNNKTILIDPMLGPNAAPISPFPIKRFSENTINLIDDLPPVDLVLLSHDHYDHLDYKSIEKLKSKTKHFYVAMGVARHLIKWGIDREKITEFDWWDNEVFEDMQITFTPTRHFSGRGLTDKAKSIWGGWAINNLTENIWFSGDSGYGSHFKKIGERLGAFDFAFMECGQYNENWHQIHMYPEESVQAAKDVQVKNIMPVHWAGFALSQHTWYEPADRFCESAIKNNQKYCVPKLGEIISTDSVVTEKWWNHIHS